MQSGKTSMSVWKFATLWPWARATRSKDNIRQYRYPVYQNKVNKSVARIVTQLFADTPGVYVHEEIGGEGTFYETRVAYLTWYFVSMRSLTFDESEKSSIIYLPVWECCRDTSRLWKSYPFISNLQRVIMNAFEYFDFLRRHIILI